ncbi:aspartate kinase [Bacillus sp. CMF21]|uniref:aspartate kinase n=1 Tax=Metabacillus dongyingensis TaxID=2874282 RepID=UPI001CBEEB4A|nr:aspartate kinase [Metabacillus dongyingensis]UAL50287.1 aspartate kinase [Metabacillus dongyingensis]USK26537.1 aspartate kinase [Bacillus sp. CMF21]
MKVVKFGGSSLASGNQVKKVFDIVTSDPDRKVVVVSAPGKRYAEDRKVTDLLIELGERSLRGERAPEYLTAVIARYSQVAEELKLPAEIVSKIENDLIELLDADKTRQDRYIDAIKASGEDSNAKLIAEYFKSRGIEASYINPKDAGLFVEETCGTAQVLKKSYENLKALRELPGILIFPGFFGYNEAGEVVTFSRSGSDITGSILANGTGADLYENFTDVDAVYSVNPNVVPNPKEIRELTYREMRELSYAGFSVFHDEALIPAFEAGIPVHIKNTNNPEAAGTRIVNERKNTNGPVIGIASDDDFCSIYVNRYLMNKEIGFGRKLLSILEDFGLTYEHSPSGIDDLSIILRQKQMNAETEELILERIRTDLKPDEVTVEHNLSLIMMVGEGMRHNIGTAARASKALAEAGVNIEMINQGSSEVSMMFGVKEAQEKKAVQALYEEFFVSVYA